MLRWWWWCGIARMVDLVWDLVRQHSAFIHRAYWKETGQLHAGSVRPNVHQSRIVYDPVGAIRRLPGSPGCAGGFDPGSEREGKAARGAHGARGPSKAVASM